MITGPTNYGSYDLVTWLTLSTLQSNLRLSFNLPIPFKFSKVIAYTSVL